MSPEEVVAKTGLSADTVRAAFERLEARGFVTRREDGSYGTGGPD
jgi:DNA-binding GntR family transcriptional regulator